MTAATAQPSVEELSAPSGASSFRRDVEGLRAIAVLMVLLFHAGVDWVPGGYAGVDVFFVISGFLITGQLLKEVERSGRVSLPRFYARRAKRLLPAAGVVLVATALMSWRVLPRTRWEEVGGDIVSSSTYLVNWRLASRSVDYLAEDSEPSPVQHFWSLAIEEQFYVIWPLLILFGAWIVSSRGVARRTTVMTLLLAVVAVPSLAWSIRATSAQPESAYFLTTTRLWELAIGAFVAVGVRQWRRISPRVGAALAWTGLAVIVMSGAVYTSSTAWPGSAALAPTLGTAAVIVGGFTSDAWGPTRVLGVRPMLVVGAMSYSLYLWHWPLIVVATERWEGLTVWGGLLIVTLSAIPAWLTYTLVENPIRRSRTLGSSPRFALSLGANFTMLGLSAGLLLGATVGASLAAPTSADERTLGAASLGTEEVPVADGLSTAPSFITPDPALATKDIPELYGDGCQVEQGSTEIATCEYGDPAGDFIVAIVGDSKIAQWLPALQLLAPEHGWKIRTYTKSACAWSAATTSRKGERYHQCVEWGADVLDRLTGDERPDVVLASGGSGSAYVDDNSDDRSPQAMVTGYQDYWSRLASVGVGVVALSDSPQPGFNVYECVSEHPDNLAECSFERNEGTGTAVLREAAEGVPTAAFVDMNDWICPVDQCPAVIGDVLVFRQGSHITATYIETMAPALERRLLPAIETVSAAAPR